jgi:hypothetical protein
MVHRVLSLHKRRQVIEGDGEKTATASGEGVGIPQTAKISIGIELNNKRDDVIDSPGRGVQEGGARPGRNHMEQLAVDARYPHQDFGS